MNKSYIIRYMAAGFAGGAICSILIILIMFLYGIFSLDNLNMNISSLRKEYSLVGAQPEKKMKMIGLKNEEGLIFLLRLDSDELKLTELYLFDHTLSLWYNENNLISCEFENSDEKDIFLSEFDDRLESSQYGLINTDGETVWYWDFDFDGTYDAYLVNDAVPKQKEMFIYYQEKWLKVDKLDHKAFSATIDQSGVLRNYKFSSKKGWILSGEKQA